MPYPNNRLFIPETSCCENSGVRALYAFGEHQALGFSPFAIDEATPEVTENITKAYELMRQINSFTAFTSSYGLLFDQQDKERIIKDGNTTITCRHYFTPTLGSSCQRRQRVWPEGGAVLKKIADDEYLLAGNGVVVSFAPRIGIGFIDEVSIDANGKLKYIRRHNGDQNHQGRHAHIACGEWKILHIKLYTY